MTARLVIFQRGNLKKANTLLSISVGTRCSVSSCTKCAGGLPAPKSIPGQMGGKRLGDKGPRGGTKKRGGGEKRFHAGCLKSFEGINGNGRLASIASSARTNRDLKPILEGEAREVQSGLSKAQDDGARSPGGAQGETNWNMKKGWVQLEARPILNTFLKTGRRGRTNVNWGKGRKQNHTDSTKTTQK